MGLFNNFNRNKTFSFTEELKDKNLRVYASTVIRGSKDEEMTGFIYSIDWNKKEIIKKIPVPIDTSNPFWNSRGGNRGGRGIVYHGNKLYVATAMSILVYDLDLNLIDKISNPLFAGVHEMCKEADGIWVTSTVHDLVLKVDFNGETIEEWWGSEDKTLQNKFGFKGRNLNLNLDFPEESFKEAYEKYCDEEIFHINTVCVNERGVYILSSKKKSFMKIKPDPSQVIIKDTSLKGPHNGIFTNSGRIIINNTGKQTVRIYNEQNGELLKEIKTKIYKNLMGGNQFAKPGWQRGLTNVHSNYYLVGTSPATLFELDIERELIGEDLVLEDDVTHCIHGVLSILVE